MSEGAYLWYYDKVVRELNKRRPAAYFVYTIMASAENDKDITDVEFLHLADLVSSRGGTSRSPQEMTKAQKQLIGLKDITYNNPRLRNTMPSFREAMVKQIMAAEEESKRKWWEHKPGKGWKRTTPTPTEEMHATIAQNEYQERKESTPGIVGQATRIRHAVAAGSSEHREFLIDNLNNLADGKKIDEDTLLELLERGWIAYKGNDYVVSHLGETVLAGGPPKAETGPKLNAASKVAEVLAATPAARAVIVPENKRDAKNIKVLASDGYVQPTDEGYKLTRKGIDERQRLRHQKAKPQIPLDVEFMRLGEDLFKLPEKDRSFLQNPLTESDTRLLASIAQGNSRTDDEKSLRRLMQLEKQGYVELHDRGRGFAQVALLSRGRAHVENFAPAALLHHSPSSPLAQATAPSRQFRFVGGLLAQREKKEVGELEDPESPFKAQLGETGTERLNFWKKFSAAGLKRAGLEGKGMAVARETMRELGKEYREMRDYKVHNPRDFRNPYKNPLEQPRFMKYIGDTRRFLDPWMNKVRRVYHGAIVTIAAEDAAKKGPIPVMTRGKGFGLIMRRSELAPVPEATHRHHEGGYWGQLRLQGADALYARRASRTQNPIALTTQEQRILQNMMGGHVAYPETFDDKRCLIELRNAKFVRGSNESGYTLTRKGEESLFRHNPKFTKLKKKPSIFTSIMAPILEAARDVAKTPQGKAARRFLTLKVNKGDRSGKHISVRVPPDVALLVVKDYYMPDVVEGKVIPRDAINWSKAADLASLKSGKGRVLKPLFLEGVAR